MQLKCSYSLPIRFTFHLKGKLIATLAVSTFTARKCFLRLSMTAIQKLFLYVKMINIFKIKDKDLQIHSVITVPMILLT